MGFSQKVRRQAFVDAPQFRDIPCRPVSVRSLFEGVASGVDFMRVSCNSVALLGPSFQGTCQAWDMWTVQLYKQMHVCRDVAEQFLCIVRLFMKTRKREKK